MRIHACIHACMRVVTVAVAVAVAMAAYPLALSDIAEVHVPAHLLTQLGLRVDECALTARP